MPFSVSGKIHSSIPPLPLRFEALRKVSEKNYRVYAFFAGHILSSQYLYQEERLFLVSCTSQKLL